MADRILHQVKAVQFKGDLAVQRQQNAVGVQFGGRSDLRPVCPKVDKISLMRVVFDAAVPHMRRQKEKFVAADRIFFPVDSKGTLSAAHQNQNPLGHHAVRMDIPSAEFVDHFDVDVSC